MPDSQKDELSCDGGNGIPDRGNNSRFLDVIDRTTVRSNDQFEAEQERVVVPEEETFPIDRYLVESRREPDLGLIPQLFS